MLVVCITWCTMQTWMFKDQTSNGLSLVTKSKSLLLDIYNYSVPSLKWHLEVTKLTKLLECKGNKNLKNVKK